MTFPTRLLAKSTTTPGSPGYYESYVGHLIETTNVARQLSTLHGAAFLRSMGLDPAAWSGRLEQAATRGAYLHDAGKANHQFQRLVARSSTLPQAFRHEIISLFLSLRWAPLSAWVFDGCGDDDVVTYSSLFAAAGHHLKLDGLGLSPAEGSGDGELVLYTDHPDVHELIERGRKAFGAPPTKDDAVSGMKLDLLGDPMKEVREWIGRKALPWWDESDADTRRFVALVKALVVGADLVASAAARDKDVRGWAESVLGRTCSPDELLLIVERRLRGGSLRPFQQRVAESRARVTFVHAGCGTGKTLAAYLWARGRAQDDSRKIFFCYPTTGTATQGYVDYAWDDDIESRLIHSRSEVDMELLQDAPGDAPDPLDPVVRYQALAAWDAPLVLATADTVLGLTQNNRRGLFSFPPIAGAAFVFDEIHSYDGRLFGSLLRFLEAFPGAPVLLMTASLQRERLRRIEGLLAGRGEALEIVEGPEDLETVKRYSIVAAGRTPPWAEVTKLLREGGKVLWVANTVEKARAIARDAGAQLREGTEPLIYHSRYRYIDRVAHHKSVVDAFDPSRNKGAALAITTQVCEVSLDISADMLVTDVAPIPALIQRMGRVNRREPSTAPRPVYVTDVDRPDPYTGDEIALARRWLDELSPRGAGGPSALSQADLASAFGRFEDEPGADKVGSAWLDGGPFSSPASLREAGYTISVVRGEDRQACVTSGGRILNRDVLKYSIPMPFGPVAQKVTGWERLNGALVAPSGSIDYSPRTGGAWR
jgi:CRISPR-associated endonuclease/helicase Cas3